jgi:hypothetical protein
MARQGFQGHVPDGGGAPRSRSAAMFDDDSRYSGNLFVQTDDVSVMKSLWDVPGTHHKQFDTVLRVLPGIDANGEWGPFRVDAGRGQFGPWLYASWAVRSFGDPPVTFWLCSDYEYQVLKYDPRTHPVSILYQAISRGVEEAVKEVKPWWSPMVKGNDRHCIKKPGPMFLTQNLIYGRGGKVYDPPLGADEGDKVIVFDLANDGGKTLRGLLERRKKYDNPHEAPDWRDFNAYYEAGDITDFDGGKFVQIFPIDRDPNQEKIAAQLVQPGQRRSLSRATVAEGRNRDFNDDSGERRKFGYGVRLLDEYGTWDPRITEEYREPFRAKVQLWDDIIILYSHEEAARIIHPRVRFNGELKLDVLHYAWQDHRSWLPTKDSDAYAEWVARSQVAPGGYDPDAGTVGEKLPTPEQTTSADYRPSRRHSEEFPEDQPRRRSLGGRPVPEPAPEPAAPPVAAPQPQPLDDATPAPAVANGSAMVRQQVAAEADQAPEQAAGPAPVRATRASYQPRQRRDPDGEITELPPDVSAAVAPFRPSAAVAAAEAEAAEAAEVEVPEPEPEPTPAPEPVKTVKPSSAELLAAARANLRKR